MRKGGEGASPLPVLLLHACSLRSQPSSHVRSLSSRFLLLAPLVCLGNQRLANNLKRIDC